MNKQSLILLSALCIGSVCAFSDDSIENNHDSFSIEDHESISLVEDEDETDDVATQSESDDEESMEPTPNSLSDRHANELFVELDFLYWFAKQEGNQYAVTGSALTVPGTEDPNTHLTPGPVKAGKVYELDFRMSPGFKVGTGINLAHGQWDVFLEYSYLHSHAKGSTHSNNLNAGIIPMFSYAANNSILSDATYNNGSAGFVSEAESNWTLNFNNINLELGSNANPLNNLSLRPYLGIQGSWQKQIFNTTYQVSSITNVNDVLGKNTVAFHQHFWGVGLRVGIDGVWKCYSHLDLFGNFAAAVLWGQFNCKSRSYDTNNEISPPYQDVLITNQANDLSSLSPLVDVEIGIQSAWTFESKYRLVAQIAWENQVWFFQNQHSSSIADTSLILQGLTCKLRFAF